MNGDHGNNGLSDNRKRETAWIHMNILQHENLHAVKGWEKNGAKALVNVLRVYRKEFYDLIVYGKGKVLRVPTLK